ncbi:hypothetical protein M405DRAFT_936614 [Rhizopogon salebrosus TDB-379]|nr:hypothetical protein M405DRAFT_936614 [Rhizopogon salebrosus TDB-379]
MPPNDGGAGRMDKDGYDKDGDDKGGDDKDGDDKDELSGLEYSEAAVITQRWTSSLRFVFYKTARAEVALDPPRDKDAVIVDV